MSNNRLSSSQYILVVLPAIIAGVLSGVISSYFLKAAALPVEKPIKTFTEEQIAAIAARQYERVAKKTETIVSAGEFRLVDKDGKLHGKWGCDEFGSAGLFLFGKDAQPRIDLVCADGASWLTFKDRDGNGRVELSSSADGEAGAFFMDKNGKKRGVLCLDKDGNPALILADKNGKGMASVGFEDEQANLCLFGRNAQMIALKVPKDGGPTLVVCDKTGKSRAALVFSGDGNPALTLSDKKGKPRIGIGLEADGQPSLCLIGDRGNVRATLGYAELDSPETGTVTKRTVSSLLLFDPEGKVIWKAP